MDLIDESLSRNENQFAVYEACVVDGYKRVVVAAGRKFGKTYTSSRIARDWAIQTKGTILIAAPEYSYLRDQNVPELRAAIPAPALRGGAWETAYNKSEHALELRNGARVLLRSMENADSVRPLSIDGLIAEEFSLWPLYAWQECVRPTLMARDAKALFIFTPKGMNQAHQERTRAVAGEEGYKYFHYTSWDGAVPKANVDAEARGLPEGILRQEFYAEFLDDLGGVFHGVRDCVGGDCEEPRVGVWYTAGLDLGKTKDPSVLTIMNRDTGHVVYREAILTLDWKTQRGLIKAAIHRYNDAPVWLDSTGVGSPVYDELVADGVRVKPYHFTNETKRALIEKLIIAISEQRITYPEDPVLLNELNIYTAKQTPSGNVTYSAPEGYHDDCVISLALAVWGMGSGKITPPLPGVRRERLPV